MKLTAKQLSAMTMNGNIINQVDATVLLKFASLLGEARIVGTEKKIEGKRGRVSNIWEVSDKFMLDMKLNGITSANEPAKIVKNKPEVVETVKEKDVFKPAKKPTKKSSNNAGVVA